MCPVGSLKYGCDCLLYVNRNAPWQEAQQHCASMSGKLVSIHSRGMQKHIKTFLTAQLGKPTSLHFGSTMNKFTGWDTLRIDMASCTGLKTETRRGQSKGCEAY
jgi:hypothetical protein